MNEHLNTIILDYLKEGFSQAEIARKLKDRNIKPNSLSSVEKKIKDIREKYSAKTLFHLAYILSQEDKMS